MKSETELKNLYDSLTADEREFIYRKVLYNFIKEDVLQFIEDNYEENKIKDPEGFAEVIAERWAFDGDYNCEISHWDNISNHIERNLGA